MLGVRRELIVWHSVSEEGSVCGVYALRSRRALHTRAVQRVLLSCLVPEARAQRRAVTATPGNSQVLWDAAGLNEFVICDRRHGVLGIERNSCEIVGTRGRIMLLNTERNASSFLRMLSECVGGIGWRVDGGL